MMNINQRLGRFLLMLLLLGSWVVCEASNDFVMQTIRVDGLHYVKQPTFWYYFNVKPGQKISEKALNQRLLALYKTGFFEDVTIYREGRATWQIVVQERSLLKEISVDGDSTKALLDSAKSILKKNGIRVGQLLQKNQLHDSVSAIRALYAQAGFQQADVQVKTQSLTHHEVALSIQIDSHQKTKITSISFKGNRQYSSETILGHWVLAPTRFWSFFTGNNIYTEAKWHHDLEATKTFYRNRGFIDMQVDSSKVLFADDHKTASLSVQLKEGAQYHLISYKLLGLNEAQKKAVRAHLTGIRSGMIYREDDMQAVVKSIKHQLSDWGFIETNVDVLTQVDHEKHTVSLTFSINTGKPFYVRHIVFKGNEKTADSVLLFGMEQHEDSLFSAESIALSQRKLAVMPYIKSIAFETVPVPGRADQVDLVAHIEERSATTLGLAMGYAQEQGLILNVNFNNRNFLGLGRTFSVSFNRTGWYERYSVDYVNPAFRSDGTSLGFGVFYKHTKPKGIDLGDYVRDSYGAQINSSIPLSVNTHLSYGLSYERSKLTHYDPLFTPVSDFVAAHGTHFETYELNTGWGYNTQDRFLFPTSGQDINLSLLTGLPLSSRAVGYYKLYGSWTHDLTVIKMGPRLPLVLETHADFGYGGGYGGYGNDLPFFNRFYAGGIGSVKGYEYNSLGPKDANDNTMGGNVLTDFSVSLLYPSGLIQDAWFGLFLDGGNVFHDSVNLGAFRYSVGVRFTWQTPLNVPIVLSYAFPFHDKAGDQRKHFQFLIGTEF
jgi:outer membrane protein insertion porin family